ncbi:molybdopterin-binding protein [Cognatiyoonia sp. IB215182]|uniref:molybdopterin-binding protein n=1 Tax=Cognatiyoonia sp. IB215182 TaxID=3097353 RepID=UPI002A13C534|nr:molybdopterin-binding protein [Cognatiyoonia sp. IB215182]MDX8353282.1 molybdopterin-binding protein [Cognatiyoonia sp. IB215182]
MKFGELPTRDAAGAILAHSIALPGGRLRKGHVLKPADIAALVSVGHESVIAARLEAADLGEDVAAARLASALAGEGLRLTKAATGRVNLLAEAPGIARIDAAKVNAFNAVNPMITVATLPPSHRVDAGTMVATVKIISYGVPGSDVEKAAAAGQDALQAIAPTIRTATLIETRTGEDPSAKGRAALRGRLDRLDVTLDGRVIVDHRAVPLAEAIKTAKGQVVFVLTASATSDPDDVGPAAVRAAGGVVTQFGMPVDPGNLLFLGQIGGKPVIGLPGCARSPALNGADWVMERVLCGIDLTPDDFAQMGVGGLLKEIPTRPKPRGDIED